MTTVNNWFRRLATWTLFAGVGYLVAWLLSYTAIMRFDFSYVPTYFVLGWTGGGELPSSINFISLVLTGVLLAASVIAKFVRRQKRD